MQGKGSLPTLIGFLVLTVGGGILIGFVTPPGAWYAGLAKPPFNPPNWIFAPVWTLLYVMIAVAGFHAWQRGPRTRAMAMWLAQLALNFVWSPVFFGLHRPAMALAIVAALLVAVLAFIALTWRSHRIAALLFVPYAAWVAFATLLNAAIVALN